MHVDGGVGGQFFVAPPAVMASTSTDRIPASQLYIVVNSALQPDFQVVDRSTPSILAQTVGMAVKVDLRLMLDRTYVAAKNAASALTPPPFRRDFNAPSRGPFDPELHEGVVRRRLRRRAKAPPHSPTTPPPYPGPPATDTQISKRNDIAKPGATK